MFMDNLTTDWKRQIYRHGEIVLLQVWTPSELRWLKTSAFAQAKRRLYEAKSDFAITTILATPYLYVSQRTR